jgi:DNA repair protein RadD
MQLRPYQINAVQSLRDNIANGIKAQILCSPTGSGKSVIASHMVKAVYEKNKKALFLVDRRVLVRQFSQHLERLGIKHGVIMAKDPMYDPSQQIQVASCQTLEKHKYLGIYDVVFYDEAHINRAIIKRITEEMPNAVLIGLTATPLTQGLNKTYKAVVNVATMANLVVEKFLVPFKVFIAQEIDVTGVKIISGEYARDELEKRATLIVGDVVSDYLHISKTVWGEQKKTIVFCSGVDHGKQLCEAFNAIGKSFVDINYRHDDEYKAEVIREFSKPDSSIDGLISCDILTRGFDVPDVEHVILARPLRKSLSTHIQMVGRGARISPDKNFCVIQCNSGNYLRFLEDFEEIYENGIKELDDHKEKPKAEKSKKEKKERTCPRCMALWPVNSQHCHSCGFVRPVTANVASVDGEIVELRGKTYKREFTSEQKQQCYWELMGYARKNGYKDGWAYHKYIERFGVAPAWKKKYIQPSPETVAYITHLNIKFHNKKYNKARA